MVARLAHARFIVLPLLLVLGAASAARGQAIGDGDVRFLASPPPGLIHQHVKRLVITLDSLRTGWVRNEQCHYALDPVPELEVVFDPARVRDLRILRADHVGKAWVEGASVQLQNVRPDAVLCLASENHILGVSGDGGRYMLIVGPFMRRFLDGYFPMKMVLSVDYPPNLLSLHDIGPEPIKPIPLPDNGHIEVSALFEGRLFVAMQFLPARSK